MPLIWRRPAESGSTWTSCVRGDVHRLRAPRDVRGREQRGARFAVVVQADDLLLSTLLVAPTSQSAVPRVFRPTVQVNGQATQVLVEQTTAVAPERLGELVGHLRHHEVEQIDAALRLVLGLD